MSSDFRNNLTLILSAATVLVLLVLVVISMTRTPQTKPVSETAAPVPEVAQTQNLALVDEKPAVETGNQAPEVPNEQELVTPAAEPPVGRRTERVLTPESPGFSIDDLAHLDLGLDKPAQEQSGPIRTETEIQLSPSATPPPAAVAQPPSPPQVVEEATRQPEPTIAVSEFKNCGQLQVPTGFKLAMFALRAGSDPVVVCLGEAVASTQCGQYSAQIKTEEELLDVFVTSRPDDAVCSVGAAVGQGQVFLCSVQQLMNQGTGENKTSAQWQAEFEQAPGETFATMYFDNQDAFDNPGSDAAYDCKQYQVSYD